MRLLPLSSRRVWSWTLLLLVAGMAEADSLPLQIEGPAEAASLSLADRPDAIRPSRADSWLVTGRLAMPDFAIPHTDCARLQDAGGRDIPLIVETNSLLREFGEIVGMRVAFELDPLTLTAGLPVLTWGAAVAASNSAVPELVFPPDLAARIRSFSTAPDAGGPESASFATIEIIADSQADRYYLWYLLPMAMIFVLLAIRKRCNP